MIFSEAPTDWKQLQEMVKIILEDIGYNVEVGKSIPLVRGKKEADVFATLTKITSKPTLICECKYYNSNIPQEKVHAFRTVIQDSGTNIGFIISKIGFQKGCYEAVDKTNIELFSWNEFQNYFFSDWTKNVEKKLKKISTPLGEITDYFRGIEELTERYCPVYYLCKSQKICDMNFPFVFNLPKYDIFDNSEYQFNSPKDYESKMTSLIEEGIKYSREFLNI